MFIAIDPPRPAENPQAHSSSATPQHPTKELVLSTMSLAGLVALALTALPSVFAHGGVLSYSNAGTWYWGWQPYDTPTGQTSIQRPWSS